MRKTQKSFFVQNCKRKIEMEIFVFCEIAFEPIITRTCQAPQNDLQNLSFVKDEHSYGEKMARKSRTKVIHKVSFIVNRSLF